GGERGGADRRRAAAVAVERPGGPGGPGHPGGGGGAPAPGGGPRPAGGGRDPRRTADHRGRPPVPGLRRCPGPQPPGAGRQGGGGGDAPVLARRAARERLVTDVLDADPPGGEPPGGSDRRRRRRRPPPRVVLGVLAVLVLGVLGGGLWLYLKLKGAATIQAGEYDLRKNLSMGEARAALERGPSIKFQKLVIPEGLTLDQIADRVGALPGRNKATFLAAARSGTVRSKWQPPGNTSLEGLLFPDTYLITDKEDDAAVLRRLTGRFDQVADEIGLATAAPPAGLGPYQVIVGASLVESEAKVPEDR